MSIGSGDGLDWGVEEAINGFRVVAGPSTFGSDGAKAGSPAYRQ